MRIGRSYFTKPRALDKIPQSVDYGGTFRLDGELQPVIRSYRRAIMGEDVTDQLLLDVTGLAMAESVDESALARVLNRIMRSSAEGPSNSFQANI